MDTPYFNIEDLVARLAAEGIEAQRAASNVTMSPYDQVEFVATNAGADSTVHIGLSDLREWDDEDGILVGAYDYEKGEPFGGDARDLRSPEEAVAYAVELAGKAKAA